jgi:hypothetical protein
MGANRYQEDKNCVPGQVRTEVWRRGRDSNPRFANGLRATLHPVSSQHILAFQHPVHNTMRWDDTGWNGSSMVAGLLLKHRLQSGLGFLPRLARASPNPGNCSRGYARLVLEPFGPAHATKKFGRGCQTVCILRDTLFVRTGFAIRVDCTFRVYRSC